MKPGIYHDLSNEEYHSQTAINASFLKSWIMKSPLHAVNAKGGIGQTIADMGTAIHSEALEPDLENVVRSDEKSRATKAFKEHYELCKAQGKVLLPAKDYLNVKGAVHGLVNDDGEVVGGLMNDGHCGKLLKSSGKICEASIFVTHPDTGLLLKARPDIFSPTLGVMGDVKSAQDASPRGFGKAIFKLGYHYQAAHYLMCAKLIGWDVKHWGFLAVEKEPPYPAHFHTLGEEALEHSARVVEAALHEIAEAKETGNPGTRWGSYTVHHLPEYMANNED